MFYVLKTCLFLVCLAFHPGAQAMQAGGDRGADPSLRHIATSSGRPAFERTDNLYYWAIGSGAAPVIPEGPRGFNFPAAAGGGLAGMDLSEDNDWPKKPNLSIFPYLLSHLPGQPYKEFYDFVQEWHRSACAIVYYPETGDPKIVGSGGLREGNRVATARHNFQGIPIERLYVRFSNYRLERTQSPQWMAIYESYLDIPVEHCIPARDGLDAGHLMLPIVDGEFLGRYARSVQTEIDQFDTNMPSGVYAAFHFAGGMPQVSVGRIEGSDFGTNLHDEAVLQLGSGASGAVLIQQNHRRIISEGISIYRMIRADGSVDRRLISFSRMEHPGWDDKISAPYSHNPHFEVVLRDALNESGYEFIRWRDEAHVNRRYAGRFPKPGQALYRVADPRHGTHHIIPIDDLLYLWDYVYRLDENTTARLQLQVKREEQEAWRNYGPGIDREQRLRELHAQELTEQYSRFHPLLNRLCPHFYEDHQLIRNETQRGFAWSLWNLFQGWDKDYRVDDPNDPAVISRRQNPQDFSEKTRPAGLEETLWNRVKALYDVLQRLKRTKVPDRALENQTYDALVDISIFWLNGGQLRSLHPFNPDEWEQVPGRKDGHVVHWVKPS